MELILLMLCVIIKRRKMEIYRNDPKMVVQMLAVGESTGAMDTMLTKIADFYEEEVDAAVASLTSLLEPFIMVFLGGVVGGVMIAMYMPIFSMAGNVKQ